MYSNHRAFERAGQRAAISHPRVPLRWLILGAAGLSTATLSPSVSAAEEASETASEVPAPDSGFQWGLRLGAELPLGNADGGSSKGDAFDLRSGGEMSQAVSYGVPLALDLGYRSSEHWLWMVNAQTGLGGFGDGCPPGVSCSWSEVRIGFSGLYSFAGTGSTPWLSAGLGYEWLRLWGAAQNEVSGLSLARELLGGPQVNISGGYAFEITEALDIGPYLAGTAGMYLTSHFQCSGAAQCEGNSAVEEKAVHAWLSAGVRGSYGP
jgi:hypothetical protein